MYARHRPGKKGMGNELRLMRFLQVDDSEVISFLLSTEIIPLCLRTMEMGSELSKTVSDGTSYHFCICMQALASF